MSADDWFPSSGDWVADGLGHPRRTKDISKFTVGEFVPVQKHLKLCPAKHSEQALREVHVGKLGELSAEGKAAVLAVMAAEDRAAALALLPAAERATWQVLAADIDKLVDTDIADWKKRLKDFAKKQARKPQLEVCSLYRNQRVHTQQQPTALCH